MMMNLFSIFDPSLFFFNFYSWTLVMFFLFYNVNIIYKSQKNFFILINNLILFLFKEMKPLLAMNYKKGIAFFMLSLFFSFLMMNFFSLFSFVFTGTAHISLTFTLSFSMWLSMMIFGWSNNMNSMMIHLVPLGTPLALMNLMVLIEMISNIIRPITLSVRITANMVAGHLLMSLLGSFSIMSYLNFIVSSFGMIILSFLEMAVSFIQAYVFMTLLTLYSTEINYE